MNPPTVESSGARSVEAVHIPSPDPRSSEASASSSTITILDFLTDGSLIQLCEELSTLSGLRVWLRDASGGRIERVEGAQGRDRWRVLPEALGQSAEGGEKDSEAFTSVPLEIEGRLLGSIAIAGSKAVALEVGSTRVREGIERVVRLTAMVTSDFCRREEDLRHSVREVQALFRLASLLARATDPDAVLQTALDLALDVMELDAGSVVLFENELLEDPEHEADLVLKASKGLSSAWLQNPRPASKGRLFDRLALEGEVVVSEDLRQDERVQLRREVEREGLVSFINAGLVFQDRPLGVIRLYSRKPRVFSPADRRLIKSIALQAAVAVQQARLLRVEQEDAKIRRQLVLAANVQRRMMPRGLPVFANLDLAAKYEPSFDLGGDFYDLFELAGNLALAVGDVVGKGVAAALLMAAVRATLRAHVQDVYHIDEVISRVNTALCRDTRSSEFATIFYGVVDPVTMRMTYCSAGHDPPMVVRCCTKAGAPHAPDSSDVEELSTGGMAVGIDPAQRYQRGTFDLRPGDVLVAYTDGVTDTFNAKKQRFGRDRLRKALLAALRENPSASAAFVLDHLLGEARDFQGGDEPAAQMSDDRTLVVMRVRAERDR
jgi:phosphoserine phosphatase RsbU/P